MWLTCVLNGARIWKKGANFILEFKSFSPLLALFSFQLSDLSAQLCAPATGSAPRHRGLRQPSPQHPADVHGHTRSVQEMKWSWGASPRPPWVEACQEPDAQGRQACPSGIKDPRRSAQRKRFPAESHTHLPPQRLRPARHRAEPFVSNCTPKESTDLLPITAKTLTDHHQIGEKG